MSALLLAGCSSVPSQGQNKDAEQTGQMSFADPQSAVEALATAAKNRDASQLLNLFGPEGKQVISSGDPVADRQNLEAFVTTFQQNWALQDSSENPGEMELVVGDDRWPFPIPLVKGRDGWRFDTEAGKEEVLARRIGRNELAVISTCRTYVLAQKRYARESHDGNPSGLYAQQVRSTPGMHNGLYWAARGDEKPSPLGDLAAQAESAGYTTGPLAKPAPYRGYYFRILTQQGPSAPGGAMNYIVNGEMTRGFALIAHPAEYGNSGIMTFIVNQDGSVYQADLGPNTPRIVGRINAFNPDPGDGWSRVE